MGSGKYSQKLTTAQWLDFNVAQRQHLNFVEQMVPMVLPLLVAGLFQPRLTVLCGAASIVGRLLYSLGYLTGNPKSRIMGTPFIYISMLTCVIVSLMGSFAAAGGVKGLLALVGDVATLNILA